MNTRDLNNSRRFDVHTWSKHPESNTFVNALWPEIRQRFDPPSKWGRKQRSPNKKQFKVLLLDLFLCWTEDPEKSLGVPMSPGDYKEGSIYNALSISSKTIEIINALHDAELIEWHKGSEAARKTTRIWPTQKLVDYFKAATLSAEEVLRHHNKEVVVLNAKVVKQSDTAEDWATKSIEYQDADHPGIVKWRSDLQTYNELLSNAYVDIGSLVEPWVLKHVQTKRGLEARKIPIDQNHKFVRRIFYRGSWELGGRFHGGFWQQVGSDLRRDILINEHRTVEVDYKGMHVSIACALEGFELKLDPYAVPLMLPDFTEVAQREVVKGLVLMAINAQTLSKAYSAFRGGEKTGSKAKKLKNLQLQALLEAVIKRVPVLEKYIGRDKGVELMRIDGEITSQIINHFTSKKIPVLSVHDSYIIAADKDHELTEAMDKAASRVVGKKVNLETEGFGYGSLRAMTNLDGTDQLTKLTRLEALRSKESEVVRTKEYSQRVKDWMMRNR